MKLFLLFLFFSIYSFSQKTITVNNDVRIEFESVKDTIFTGYNNLVYLKSSSNLKGFTVEMLYSLVKKYESSPNAYIIIPSRSVKDDYFIIKYKDKEIKRQKVAVSVLSKETAKRLLNKSQ